LQSLLLGVDTMIVVGRSPSTIDATAEGSGSALDVTRG
jgi:hypothetical protein